MTMKRVLSICSNSVKYFSREMYLLLAALILVKKPIDSSKFLNQWENEYQNIADPDSEEVISRLRNIKNALNKLVNSNDEPILELGAGYGRITKSLVQNFNLISIEPDQLLFTELEKVNKNSVQCSFQEIHKIFEHTKYFDFAFSIRSLEYLNLFELIIFMRRLSQFTTILVCWENSISIRRVALASFFVNKLKVIKIELYL
jgi:hypothetical protein